MELKMELEPKEQNRPLRIEWILRTKKRNLKE